jgi:hypothetical protein
MSKEIQQKLLTAQQEELKRLNELLNKYQNKNKECLKEMV